jgi:hypothetical protein
MRIAAVIIAFAIAGVGLLWAFLFALLTTLFLFQNRHGGLRMAFEEYLNEVPPARLVMAAFALTLGLCFLMLGTVLLRADKAPTDPNQESGG